MKVFHVLLFFEYTLMSKMMIEWAAAVDVDAVGKMNSRWLAVRLLRNS
jgi:hypothetical protein